MLTAVSVSADSQLINWSTAAPNFNRGDFDTATGNYTVPANGVYSILATINYATEAAISEELGAGIVPTFAVRRSAPSAADLVTGQIPVLNVDISSVLSLRTVLGNGAITLAGEAELGAGDVIGLYYVADGLTAALDLGGANGVHWSINRISL